MAGFLTGFILYVINSDKARESDLANGSETAAEHNLRISRLAFGHHSPF